MCRNRWHCGAEKNISLLHRLPPASVFAAGECATRSCRIRPSSRALVDRRIHTWEFVLWLRSNAVNPRRQLEEERSRKRRVARDKAAYSNFKVHKALIGDKIDSFVDKLLNALVWVDDTDVGVSE